MPVRYQLAGRIGVIHIDNPPVNALSHAVRAGLQAAIREAQDDESEACVIICAGRTFVAGADITEFGKPPQQPWLPDLLNELEASAKPVVAALHGTALGGGLELALASHYRVALESARLGLPEVLLGLLPGAGGTQRVPRLAGCEAALDLMTSGKPIAAGQALAAGLVDEVVTDNLQDAAIAAAEAIIDGSKASRVSSELQVAEPEAGLFDRYRAMLAKRMRGQVAPQKIVDCVEAASRHDFADGLKLEREAFLELMAGEQSAGMRHMFFAEREAARVRGIGKDTPLREVSEVAVIGGGTMGSGIAMNFANAGLQVKLLEINDDALQKGLEIIDRNYAGGVKRGKMSESAAREKRALISGTTDYDDLASADLVIEAVFENLQLKQDIFERLDGICKPGAILATNTSYQDVNEIAAVTGRPADVLGLHFFSPAHIMKLLEIVRAEKTADDVLATCLSLAKKIRKIPVVAGVCYGFIGNRMLQPYGREAQLCLIEGATPSAVDSAMESWGMAMGPLRVFDLAGLDVGYKARQQLSDEQRGDPKVYRVADALVESGRLGQKAGAGFYRYDPETRGCLADDEVEQLIEDESRRLGISRRDIPADEIVDRLTHALINEGMRILDEGIAQRASDIDVVYVYGYGYPAYRGGPMHYADTVGLPRVLERILEFEKTLDSGNWSPAPLLRRLVEEGRTLSQWDAER